jgi:hypothetical protein
VYDLCGDEKKLIKFIGDFARNYYNCPDLRKIMCPNWNQEDRLAVEMYRA